MREQLIMRSICYDSVALSGATEYLLFSDADDENGSRFNEVSEIKLVEWIFGHPYNFKDYLFYEELGIGKEYSLFLEVKKHLIKDTSGPGDIDILLVNKLKPHLSIAFQVKRIKASISGDDEAEIKIGNIDKGVQQTKHMFQKYRFHKNYLMLIIVNDAQKRKHSQQVFRYATLDEKKVIYKHSGFGDLPEETGIYVFEISQPSANSIEHTAVLAAKALRQAKPIEQLQDTTLRINAFLQSLSQT